MKVLLLTDNDNTKGGAENYFHTLSQELKSIYGLQVYTIAFGEKSAEGQDFKILPQTRHAIAKLFWRIFSHPSIYLKLKKTIHNFAPDVIHLHNYKHHTAAILKAIKGQRIIHSAHDFSLLCPTAQNIHRDGSVCETGIRKACFWKHRVKFSPFVYPFITYAYYQTKRKIRATTTKVLAPSPILANYLRKNNFPNVQFVPLFNDHTLTDSSFSMMQSTHFLFAAHLGKHKGTDILLQEFAQALQTIPTLVLHIAGEGPEMKKMQRSAKRLNIQNQLIFHGWVADLSKLYQQCAALIFPSIGMESFGLVMTEAMAQARAIIAANRSTAPWLVENQVNGLLFDPLRPGELANCIILLAKHPEEAQRLGLNGYQKAKNLPTRPQVLAQVLANYHL